ncbi:MAG: PilW family protein [Rubrivivax sp.]|nr:PilW family protein [Rubrivivax sp.]
MRTRPVRPRGFTLVELLVAVALGMLITVAVSAMLVRQEGARRSLTSTNDVLLNGAHVAHLVDRMLRGAGSGFSQAWQSAYGCRLAVARGGTQLLPRGSDWPAPFAAVSRSPRLAPVLVHSGAGAGGSDVLAVASGNSGLAEAPLRALAGSATVNSVRVPATVGLRANDLILLAEAGRADCMLQQAATGFAGGATQQIDFGADYSAGTIGTLNLADFGGVGDVSVLPMGNGAGNIPQVLLMGIGADRTLVALDMLRLAGGADDPVTPLADGVVELRARYGIDTNNDRIVDQWVDPAASPWRAADLMDGSAGAQANLYRILAVRVAVVLRNATADRAAVTGASLLLFPDLDAALQHTRALDATEQRFRHRVLEFTVPLRNVMLI